MPKKYGMLVSMAIGDSYGAGREFIPAEAARKSNDGHTYRQHPRWPELEPGRYTDDTQMAIALSEFLLQGQRTSLALADSFVATFRRDPRAGYAQGFHDMLLDMKDGIDFLGLIEPFSDKSGGAMRAAPCGLLTDERDVIDMAMFQASLTHATKDGMEAAGAAAMLVWLCRRGVPREELGKDIGIYFPDHPWYIPWEDPVSNKGLDAAHAAITAVESNENMSDILQHCINFTGDTDTVAAIAMAAASLHPDIAQDLHPDLYEKLENGTYGRGYLENLDSLLMDKFPLVKADKFRQEHRKPKPKPKAPPISGSNIAQVLEVFDELPVYSILGIPVKKPGRKK